MAGIAGRLMRIPSGTMLLPMLAGALLHSQGIIEIELPEWLLAISVYGDRLAYWAEFLTDRCFQRCDI